MSAFVTLWRESPDWFLLAGRSVSALLGTANVFVVQRIGTSLFDRRVALLSAFYLALMFLHVSQSHFAVTDVPLTFMISWGFLTILRARAAPSTGRFVWAGVVSGLAAGTKYNGVLLFCPRVVPAPRQEAVRELPAPVRSRFPGEHALRVARSPQVPRGREDPGGGLPGRTHVPGRARLVVPPARHAPARARLADAGGERARAAPQAALRIALAVAIVLPSVQSVIAFDRLLCETDSRVLAATWIEEHVPAGATLYLAEPPFGKPEVRQERYEPCSLDPAKGEFTCGKSAGVLPAWIVLHEYPLEHWSPAPSLPVSELLASRYELAAEFTAYRPRAPLLFDEQDAFYLPLSGFDGVERPGPNLSIFRLR
jgi:hypothetical protein